MSPLDERAELARKLKPANVWAIALGTIIGFGCFVLPGDWIRQAGPLGTALGLFLGSLIMLLVGRSYGFMVGRYPVAGGEYAFSYLGFGRTHAFACGWLLSLAYLCIVPVNATALTILVKFLAPDWFTWGHMYTVAGWDVYVLEILIASAAMLLFGYLNFRGVEIIGKAQLLMALVMVGSVLLLAAGSFLKPGVTLGNLTPLFHPDKTPWAAVLAIFAISPWAYGGFDTIPQSSEEFQFSPKKTFRLIALAILIGATMYVIVTLATAVVLPWQEFMSTTPAWATGSSVRTSLGGIGLFVLSVAVVMAICTGINGFYLATSRLLFSMGRSKVLPPWFARVHPTYKTPANAILFTLAVSLVAPWFGRQVILWIVDMSAVGYAVGYVYTCLAAVVIARRLGEAGAHSHLIGALLAFSFLMLLCIPGMPAFMSFPSWISLGLWIAMGLVFYSLQAQRFRSLSTTELDYLILGGERDRESALEG
jgi:amino acid transporter